MKDSRMDNPEIKVKDKRIRELGRIVEEVKQSEEWEAVHMNILEFGMEKGMEQGIAQGIQALIESCQELGAPEEETLLKVMEKYGKSREAAMEYMNKYWK